MILRVLKSEYPVSPVHSALIFIHYFTIQAFDPIHYLNVLLTFIGTVHDMPLFFPYSILDSRPAYPA